MACFRLPQRLLKAVAFSLVLASVMWLGTPSQVQSKGVFANTKTGNLFHSKTNFSRVKLPVSKFRFRIGKGFYPPTSPPTPAPPVTNTVNVLNYGAKGDGTTDNLAAINSALAAAGTSGTIYFPPGTYVVSGPIVLNSQNANGVGATSIISTNMTTGTLFSLNGGGAITNLKLTANSAQVNGITVQNTQNPYWIQQITSQGMFRYIVALNNASNGIISGNNLSNQLAGGGAPQSYVMISDNCNNLKILANIFATTSVFGVVSLPLHSSVGSNNLTISNNTFSVVTVHPISLSGVNNCVISSNSFDFTGSPGSPTTAITIYGYASQIGSGPSSNVQIISNRLVNCGATKSGAIVLAGGPNGGQPGLMNVYVANNSIAMTPFAELFNFSFTSGIFCTGAAGGIGNLTVAGNTMTGSGFTGVTIANCINANVSNNNISNGQGEGIYFGNNNAGTFTSNGNTFTNLGTAEPKAISAAGCSVRAAIDVDTGSAATAQIITNNVYNAPANGLQYYIYCSAPRARDNISGNQTNTLLPTFVAN